MGDQKHSLERGPHVNNSRKVENKGGNVWGGKMIGSGLWSIAGGGVGVRAGRGWRFIGDTKWLGCSPGGSGESEEGSAF